MRVGLSLKGVAFMGAKWTALGSIYATVLQILQVVVLSRFLAKRDFGLMAMALFVINFSQIFLDLGISNVIIQKRTISKLQLSTLYWLNVILGASIYLLIALLAPAIAWFYREPQLVVIFHLVGVTFLLIPFAQQFDVLLQKSFRFKQIAIVTIASRSIGFVISIMLAVMDYGVFSLVYGNLAGAFVNTLLFVFIGIKQYRPALRFSLSSIRGEGFFSFGGYQMGAKMVYSLTSQVDTLFIGKVLGMESLGMYNIAKIIATRPAMVISMVSSKVSFPVFAHLQEDLHKLKAAYLKFLHLLSASNAPIYAIIIVLAPPMVSILFGQEWLAVVPCVQWLGLAGCLNCLWNSVAILLLAQGKARADFFGNLILVFIIPFSVLLGQFYGIAGIAAVLCATRLLFLLFSWKIFIKNGLPNCGFKSFIYSFIKPIAIAGVAGLIALLVTDLAGFTNNYLWLVVGVCLIGGGYLLLSQKYDKLLMKELKLLISKRRII